uniref:Uncharacterized protein n=1 Tax=Octactis speculum TaxID=3111310 RepID=A0A7S2CWS8_9STRA|eukprot:CAMPEP_0185775718 /NCGR_PEP_ID=MMETSP1174-20130828/83070_1 /TAXON_ID=35687 /ORGANISM="Dictyocha speculum, Strain CCMP1381" /LENGTH=357 /DNA_ID=CAMNT_0028463387 /DNA_START=56 /DNA_END=1129 /DNA_ORIENTATION=+
MSAVFQFGSKTTPDEPDDPKPNWTPEDLMDRAQKAIDVCEPELAVRFMRRASEAAPEDASILDQLAEVEMGVGETERAGRAWMRAIEVSGNPDHDANAERWLYVAQLREGNGARESYEHGLRLLTARLQAMQASMVHEEGSSESDIRAQMCTAYCAVAELYLTDLCLEESAEEACQNALNKAMEFNANESHEPMQGLASLRLSQGMHAEAANLMHSAYERIKSCGHAMDPELRISTARLLLECAPNVSQCADDALDLLMDSKREDDENVEIWFLMGVGFYQQSPPDLTLAYEYLERAKEMLEKVREALLQENEPFPYEVQLRLVGEQMKLVEAAALEYPPDSNEGDDNTDGTFEMED